jgi:hypothetical protein
MPIERLSASNAAKHMACHASANLEVAIPGFTLPVEEDTAASSRGTAMHNLLELAGAYTPAEMLGLARAMEYVARLRMTRRFKQLLEAEGEGWWLSTTPKTKADVVLYVQNQIEVVDYKFGKIKVEVDDNEQLKYYALSFAPLAPKAKGVTVHIVQPFVDNIESVFLTADDLDTFRQQSVDHEKQILAGDVTFGPSDHCKFCPANPHGRGIKGKPYCPALMQLYYPQVLDVDDALR